MQLLLLRLHTKNVRDQIIEGLFDADRIEQLLKPGDLTLAKAISTCRTQEAATKQRAEICVSQQRYIQSEDQVRLLSQLNSALVVALAGMREVVSAAQHKLPHATHAKKIGHLARVCRGARSSPLTLPP